MTRLVKGSLGLAAVAFACSMVPAAAFADQPIVIEGANKYAEKDALKIICKRTLQTGTRMKTRTCDTKQQWAKKEEVAKREGQEILNSLRIETRRD